MANTRDILTDESGDIKFESGDVVWGDGTVQHKRELLVTMKGSLKHAPASGVGIVNYINDDETVDMVKEIRSEFQADGMTIVGIKLEGTKLKTDAYY